jgi:cell division protease FtsH
VRALVDGAFGRARRILERNRAVLESGAAQLLEHETLAEDALRALFEKLELEPAEAA